MQLSKKDRQNLVQALSVALIRLQEDDQSAAMYDSGAFGRVVMNKMEAFMELSKRIREEAEE